MYSSESSITCPRVFGAWKFGSANTAILYHLLTGLRFPLESCVDP